jgi:hypothetical protein
MIHFHTGYPSNKLFFSLDVQLIPDYDKTTESLVTKVAENLYHDDLNLTSPLLGNLKVSFYWRNLIKEDMLADFRRWASADDHTDVPDFILFSKFP